MDVVFIEGFVLVMCDVEVIVEYVVVVEVFVEIDVFVLDVVVGIVY